MLTLSSIGIDSDIFQKRNFIKEAKGQDSLICKVECNCMKCIMLAIYNNQTEIL